MPTCLLKIECSLFRDGSPSRKLLDIEIPANSDAEVLNNLNRVVAVCREGTERAEKDHKTIGQTPAQRGQVSHP